MPLKVGKVDTDKAKQAQAELDHGDRRYWTPVEGDNKIRIMPPPEGYDTYFSKAAFHYNVGPDSKMFPCPKVSGSRRTCFLCDEADRLLHSDDEDDQAEGKELRPTRKFLITVVDLNKPDAGFQIWSPGVKAFHEVNYYFSDPEWGDVSDLENGFDFIVSRKGSGMQTQYSVRVARKSSDFLEFLRKRDLEETYDQMELPHLDEFLDFPSDKDMEAEYNGQSTGTRAKSKKDDEDEEEEDRKAPRRGRKPADEDDDDEEEEKAPPRGRREQREEPPTRRGKAPADDDADDDDDDDDDKDEAEEKAAPRSGRASGRSNTSGRTGSRLRAGLRG